MYRRGGGYYGGRGFVFIDPTDIFLIWDPRYGRHQRERADSGEMTFVEAVFSFVFGDGNPNENFEVGSRRSAELSLDMVTVCNPCIQLCACGSTPAVADHAQRLLWQIIHEWQASISPTQPIMWWAAPAVSECGANCISVVVCVCILQERRWRALGAHIQRLGGVLSAEEMAPFLDPPPVR